MAARRIQIPSEEVPIGAFLALGTALGALASPLFDAHCRRLCFLPLLGYLAPPAPRTHPAARRTLEPQGRLVKVKTPLDVAEESKAIMKPSDGGH